MATAGDMVSVLARAQGEIREVGKRFDQAASEEHALDLGRTLPALADSIDREILARFLRASV